VAPQRWATATIPWFQSDKNFSNLRKDPEFERLMREVEGHWEQYTQEFAGR